MDTDSGPHAAVPGREPRGQGQATPESAGGQDGPTLPTSRLCTSGLWSGGGHLLTMAPGHKHVAHPHVLNQPAGDEGSWEAEVGWCLDTQPQQAAGYETVPAEATLGPGVGLPEGKLWTSALRFPCGWAPGNPEALADDSSGTGMGWS